MSNDVARFDEALILWPFLVGGPLMLLSVIVMLAFEVGVLPALSGAASLLLVLPCQVSPLPFSSRCGPDRLPLPPCC